MKRKLRWAALGIAVLLVVLLSLPFWIDPNTFRPVLEADLTKALGREVKLGKLSLDVFSGSVSANDLSIADDPIFNRTPFVRANALNLEIELWPLLFSHQLNVTGLTIDRPEIVLVQNPAGDWNFSKLGGTPAPVGAVSGSPLPSTTSSQPAKPAPAGTPIQLSVKLIKINSGRLSVTRSSSQQAPVVLEEVNAELRDFSNTSIFPFSLSTKLGNGGDIKLNGKAGPLNSTDVSMTPVQANLTVAQLNAAGSSLGLGGLISFDGTGESKGGMVDVKGKVKAEKLVLSKKGTPANRAVELDFAVQHNLRKQSGIVRQGDIHIGGALAKLTGSYAREGDATALKMTLAGPGMPVTELAAMLPAMGIVLPAGSSLDGGTANAHFDLQGPANMLVTTGSLSFDHTKLKAFDLGKKMAAVERLAGIQGGNDTEIQTLSANLRVAPDGTTANDVQLIVPAIGELKGNGTISPANALDFKMTAAVHASGLISAVSDQPIPFLVEGTCSDPAFRPDVRSMATGEVKKLGGKAVNGVLKSLFGKKK